MVVTWWVDRINCIACHFVFHGICEASLVIWFNRYVCRLIFSVHCFNKKSVVCAFQEGCVYWRDCCIDQQSGMFDNNITNLAKSTLFLFLRSVQLLGTLMFLVQLKFNGMCAKSFMLKWHWCRNWVNWCFFLWRIAVWTFFHVPSKGPSIVEWNSPTLAGSLGLNMFCTISITLRYKGGFTSPWEAITWLWTGACNYKLVREESVSTVPQRIYSYWL